MSRYSSLDYLLKKASSTIHETLTEPPLQVLFKETQSSLELSFLASNENSKADNWSNFISLPTSISKTYVETDYTYTTESDWQFSNQTYINADHLEESWWNIFDERYLKHGWAWTVTLVMAYISILVAGVIGNVMVILVVILRPQMRTVTNMFIMNLAVADLFVIVFCVPSTLLTNIFSPWILGSFMCKAVAYVQGVSGCASAYSLAAISLDRCQAIYQNLERPRGFSQRICGCTVFIIWIAAMSLTIPWAVVFEVKVSEYDGLRYCVETWEIERTGNIYFLIVNLASFYAIPLLLIFVSNWVIYCHVKHRYVPQDSVSSETVRKMHRDTRHHVLKMLGIITLTFFFCWLPIYILVILIKFSEHISDSANNALGILMPIAQWLGSCNSCVNPIMYAFLNKKFRQMCKSILPAWFPCKATGNKVASRITTVAMYHKYAGKSHHQHRQLFNQKNALVTGFPEDASTVATTTMHTGSSTKSAISVCGSGSQERNFNASGAEWTTIEIFTDL